MTKQEIIEKIKLAEEISENAKNFPELTYKIVLTVLLYGEIKDDKKKKTLFIKKNKNSSNKKSNKGLSQKINDLISEGFFNEARTSREIIAKLKIIGYSMPVTSLPSYLIPKIRSQELAREEVKTKNGKIYGYIRKS